MVEKKNMVDFTQISDKLTLYFFSPSDASTAIKPMKN